MGKWKYEGLSRDGKKHLGNLQASSEREARKILRMKGIRAKKLSPPSVLEFDISEWLVEKGLVSPFGTKELSHFTKQMAIMIDAGVPITQVLEILFKSQRHPALKKSIKFIARNIDEGKTIADSMESQKGFGRLYCNLIRAGEVGGILNDILNKIAEHMDRQDKIRSKIKKAMMYPAIVVSFGIIVIWIMLVFVVPTFADMIKSQGQQLPLITRIVMGISDFLSDYILLTLGVAIAGVISLKVYIQSDSGKMIYDNLVMKLPLIGRIVIKGNLASFGRTLGTLLSSGVALIDSLDTCLEVLENRVIANDLLRLRNYVVEGRTLTDSLQHIKYFPDMVAQMVRVGEQTGQIDSMLIKIADVFEDEVSELISDMTTFIEPVVIIVLGGFTAVIMASVFLPMFMTAG